MSTAVGRGDGARARRRARRCGSTRCRRGPTDSPSRGGADAQPRLLERRQGRAHRRQRRQQPRGAQRQDRQALRRLRRQRPGGSAERVRAPDHRLALEQRAAGREGRRHHRRRAGAGHRHPQRARQGAEGDAARRHPRLRRAHGQAPVDLPRRAAQGRVRQRDVAERLVDLLGQQRHVVAASAATRSWATSTCRPRTPPATTTAARGPAPTSSRRACSRSTPGPASACGTSRSCTTACGTTTCRRPRCSPTSRVNGRRIKALAQVSKQAYVYVLDRTNGKPVWPIEERPAPKGNVPGEWYSPTQPVPSKPPAFDQQGVSDKDIIDFTPELKAEALKILSDYKYGPLYTPPVVLGSPDGPKGTDLHARHQRRRRLGRRGARQGDEHPLRAVGAPARRPRARQVAASRVHAAVRQAGRAAARRPARPARPVQAARTRGWSRSI